MWYRIEYDWQSIDKAIIQKDVDWQLAEQKPDDTWLFSSDDSDIWGELRMTSAWFDRYVDSWLYARHHACMADDLVVLNIEEIDSEDILLENDLYIYIV